MRNDSVDETILVSVCISVHNTEKYLRRCLESVFSQSLREMEIILVDNGSTDRSYDIMAEFKNMYSHRKVSIIQQKDLGLAQGRLTGVKNASGKYIAFLDADDYVELSAYEETVNIAQSHGCDIVEFQTYRKGSILSSNYTGKQSASDILKSYFTGGQIYSMLWMRIYSRKLFAHTIFPDMYTNNEDMFAFPCLLSHADNVYFMKKPLHHYCDDNELGYMSKLKSADPKKVFESKSKIIYSLKFIESNIDNYENVKREFAIYEKRRIVDYFTYPIKGYGYDSRMKKLIDTMEVNQSEVKGLISHTQSNIPVFDLLEKVCGFKFACLVYKKLYGFRKGVNI